jgi:putative nucleotidyltransferase with HDIG domain
MPAITEPIAADEEPSAAPVGTIVGPDRPLMARLLGALNAVDGLPVLESARRELLDRAGREAAGASWVAAAVELDPALTSAVLRRANSARGTPVVSTCDAVERLGRTELWRLARQLRSYSLEDLSDGWVDEVSRFRMHALAVRQAALRLALELGVRDARPVGPAALIHDVGKLVMMRAHPRYSRSVRHGGPVERVSIERRAFGIDHAAIGVLVARRWHLPRPIAEAVGGHHSIDAGGLACIVGLADLLVHYMAGGAGVSVRDLNVAAGRAGLDGGRLVGILEELPWTAAASGEPDAPCPLTPRQLELLRALAEGKRYRQIAAELGLSPSTVRSHVHCAYGALGVADRTQAVLLASERGWIGPVKVASRVARGPATVAC